MIDYRFVLPLALTACGPEAVDRRAVPTEAGAASAGAGMTESASPPASRRAAPSRDSVFSKLDEAACQLVEENKEEGPYWLRRCSGPAGWKLDWSESDLRQGLDLVAPDGRVTDLQLSSRVAAGAFNYLGRTIEWRGRDMAAPDALIVRMNAANGAEPERPDVSRLAVVRLKGTPCLVAIVEPGPGQNQRAREVADGPMSACVLD